MVTEVNTLRTLVIQHLDPAYFKLDEQQVRYWLTELPMIKEQICRVLQEEVLGNIDNSLVERHIKQVQYDCLYLRDVLYKYLVGNDLPVPLYTAAAECLEQLLEHIETRYSGFFNFSQELREPVKGEDFRIRMLVSVDALAYFFKLLNKAGGLDAGPLAQLMMCISKNFITPGIGNKYISPKSLTNKYREVVQATGLSVRKLLVRMLKLLDEEFKPVQLKKF